MRKKEAKGKGRLIVLIVLLTVFFISFSVSSFVIINANKLVFVEDYDNYLAIMEGIEANGSKDQQIVELTEQLERYKEMYSGLAEENKSLINANQSLSSKVSGLESQIAKGSSSSSSSKPKEENEEKNEPSDKEENASKNKTETNENKTPTEKNTTNKNNTSKKPVESDD